jgi:cyanophycinase-like exopeptidase
VSEAGGWLVLLGGGEFSFGETAEADRAWLEKCPPGPVGFVPAASGSVDYGRHFTDYLREAFGREVEVIPVYRVRDGRRGKNAERIVAVAAVYLGGGVADQLLDAVALTPVHEALTAKLAGGGVVVAIAAAAQACGAAVRSIGGRGIVDGLGLAPGLAIETNFDPAHDRRLRQLLGRPGVERGVGLAAGSALMIGADGRFEAVGEVFALAAADSDLVPLVGEEPPVGSEG